MSTATLLHATSPGKRRHDGTEAPRLLRHRGRVLIGNGAGLTLMLVGWFQCAVGETAEQHRLTWLVVSIAGLIVSYSVNATWLLQARHHVSTGRGAVRAELRELLQNLRTMSPVLDDSYVVVSAEGISRYHRPSCQLVAAKAVTPVTAHQRSLLAPCEMCLPGAQEHTT